MEISRRRLLQLGAAQAGLAALPVVVAAEDQTVERRTGPSILQGATDENRTQFSVVHMVTSQYIYQVRGSGGRIWNPDYVQLIEKPGQERSISKVFFSGLHLGETFSLVLQDALTGLIAEERQFKMLNTSSPSLRFAICSCMDEFRHEPGIWRDLVGQEPDLILFAGDSTYCDKGTAEADGEGRLWRRFSEARATLEIYFSQRLIPIIATWDDHDFGRNDTGRTYPFLQQSQINFQQFFAMDPNYCAALERGPGVSSRLAMGGQQFVMMDDRSFRVPGASRERYAHWGQEQEEWLLESIAGFDGMTWIVNGSQIFPQMIFKQSMSGDHPVQFAALKEALRNINRRVAFISGDVHFSEISQIETEFFGYQTYELTSSSIHSYKFPPLPDIIRNDRRIASTGEHNYLLVQSEAINGGCSFWVESHSPPGRINFGKFLNI